MAAESETRTALVLFAHGSRDVQWAAPFQAMQRKVAGLKPDAAVELAYLEMMEPSLDAAVEKLVSSGHARIVIAPLFMAQGAHLKRDLARIAGGIRERHRNVEIEVLPALGEAEPVVEAIGNWLAHHV